MNKKPAENKPKEEYCKKETSGFGLPLFKKRKYARVLEILLIVWGIVVYKFYPFKMSANLFGDFFEKFFYFIFALKISVFLKYTFPIIFIFFFTGLAFLIGRFVIRIFNIELKSNQRIVTYFGLGLGSLSLIMFFLGFFGLWFSSVIISIMGFLVIFLVIYNFDLFKLSPIKPEKIFKSFKKLEFTDKIIIFSMGGFLLLGFLGALKPEIFYDSLVYHLSLPNLYLLEHRIVPTPENIYSGIPFLTEMLYGLGMSIAGVEGAKLIHYLFGILTLGVFFSFISHGFSRRTTLLASFIFCSVPMIILLFMKTAIELSWTFFTLLVGMHILNLFDSSNQKSTKNTLILSGIFAGFTMSTKYPAWVILPVACGVIFSIGKVKDIPFFIIFKRILLFSTVAMVILCPWIIKNIVFYRNPVYPFFNDYITNSPGDEPDWRNFRSDASYGVSPAAICASFKGLKNYIIRPWNFTMKGDTGDSFVGPFFLLFLPWLFYPKWRSQKYRHLFYLFIGLWFFGSITTGYSRYFIPSLAILSILLAAIICEGTPKYIRILGMSMIFLFSVFNFCLLYFIWFNGDSWMIFAGKKTKEEYLVETHQSYVNPYYQTAVYINRNLSLSSKILVVGDGRGLYYRRKYNASSVFDRQYFIKCIENSDSAESLYEDLREEGFTHIVFNMMEMYQLLPTYTSKMYKRIDTKMVNVLKDFWGKYIQEINVEYNNSPGDLRFVVLYKLLSPEEANISHRVPRNYFLELFNRWMKNDRR